LGVKENVPQDIGVTTGSLKIEVSVQGRPACGERVTRADGAGRTEFDANL